MAPGATHTGIVTNVDVAQTLLEAAGVPAAPRMQGRSFWPDVAGTRDPDPPHDGLYYRYWMHDDRSHHVGAHYGFRTDRYCLIYFYNDGLGVPGCSDERYPAEWELYDLSRTPPSSTTSPTTRRTRRCGPTSSAGSGARRPRWATPRIQSSRDPPTSEESRFL